MSAADPDALRAEMLERWGSAAVGWAKRADGVREMGMPVSTWMIDHLDLQPGQQVLELAAGPGDTGFMAAELVKPGGTLISSDAAEPMIELARERAERQGIDNVEFKQLELEWIDLPTASVDAALCRWGVMLSVDPDAALREIRRVLRPGGRAAIAVWDESELNPWATISFQVLIMLGHAEAPDPQAPGMFTLAPAARLTDVLEGAGFVEVEVESVEIERRYADVDGYLEEQLDLSGMFSRAWAPLNEDQRAEIRRAIEQRVSDYLENDGTIRLTGRSLVAAASG